MKSPQRSDIEMIVMRVAEEHRIDWRQVIEVDAGLGYPFRSDEREGTCSLRPNRVSEDIYTRHLNERGCVSHYCYSQARNTLIWLCRCHRNRLWPASSSTRESPPKNVDWPSIGRGLTGIKESRPIEMLTCRTLIVAIARSLHMLCLPNAGISSSD